MHCAMNQDIWRIEIAFDSASPLLLSSIISELIATRFFAKPGRDWNPSRVTSIPVTSTFSPPLSCNSEVFDGVVDAEKSVWADGSNDDDDVMEVVS